MKNEWDKWTRAIDVAPTSELDKFEQAIKKAKKAGKVKLLASFGAGAALGTAGTAFVAYQIFKLILGRWMLSRSNTTR